MLNLYRRAFSHVSSDLGIQCSQLTNFPMCTPCTDIRDTVKYKEVMKQYGLGPNGGIVTSLNLFATRFDQVVELIKKRLVDHSCAIMDTPGQIEVFTWSASGTIITETLVSQFTLVQTYVLTYVYIHT